MHLATAEGHPALRVVTGVRRLDEEERAPAAVLLEQGSCFDSGRIGQGLEVGAQLLEAPDPVLGDGHAPVADALDLRVEAPLAGLPGLRVGVQEGQIGFADLAQDRALREENAALVEQLREKLTREIRTVRSREERDLTISVAK